MAAGLTSDSVEVMRDRLFMLRARVDQAKATSESRARLAGQVHALAETLIDGLVGLILYDTERLPQFKMALQAANDAKDAARVASLVNEWYPGISAPWEFDVAVGLHELKDSLARVKDLLEGGPKQP